MSEEDLREQIEVSKYYLEARHGRALRYGTPEEARASYEAIELLEDALDENWDVQRHRCRDRGLLEEFAAESREARDEGYEAAVKRDEERQKRRQKYERPSLLDRLLPGD